MYIPPHFAENRPEVLQRIMREHPLGMLVTAGTAGLDADHIPFEHEPGGEGGLGVLSAHVARANPLLQHCPTGGPVLVVFCGEQAYISPNWYPSKHEAHRQVPTWNYEVVHVQGILSVRDDERFVRRLVARLTRTHEASEPKPWKMGDAPPDYLDEMLRHIVGIEVSITSIVGKVKASQNKDARDRQGVVENLRARGHAAMADLVREG